MDNAAIVNGVPGLVAHREANEGKHVPIVGDELGALRVGGGANLINFTYSDGKIATMDVYKYVNAVNVCKRYTFTWSGDNLESISVEVLTGD